MLNYGNSFGPQAIYLEMSRLWAIHSTRQFQSSAQRKEKDLGRKNVFNTKTLKFIAVFLEERENMAYLNFLKNIAQIR